MMPIIVRCEDFERLGLWSASQCCQFCHQELARGVEGIEMTPPPNLHGAPSRVSIELCCKFAPAVYEKPIDGFTRELIAAALRARRSHARAPFGGDWSKAAA